jgi:hypothetical protein
MSYLRYLCLFTHSGVQHLLYFLVLFVFVLWFVYPMLSVSLDCSFLIAPSVFSNVYVNAYRMEVLCGATTAYVNVHKLIG